MSAALSSGRGSGRLSGAAALVLAAALLAGVATPAGGQSVVERTPNVEGVWSAGAGVLHFHFLHRFQKTDPPINKIFNSPTFLLAAGVGRGLTAGLRYASSSLLVTAEPNEWEAFGRWAPLREEAGFPIDAALQGGYNLAAQSADGEVLVGRWLGPVRLSAGGRAFSAFRGGDAAFAVLGGAQLRLTRHVALAADVASLTEDEGDAAWSAGLQLAIPYTPHSLSLHASNSNTTTLQGASFGDQETRWGFEFTVPLTLSRYLGGRSGGGTVASSPAGAAAGPTERAETVVDMDNRLRFLPDTVRIRAGESVRWRNTSDLVHTVTADPEQAALPTSVALPPGAEPFDSGDMVPGAEYVRTFPVPGEYTYFCLPHERAGMVGVLIVEAADGS